jgi:hypothetical protein
LCQVCQLVCEKRFQEVFSNPLPLQKMSFALRLLSVAGRFFAATRFLAASPGAFSYPFESPCRSPCGLFLVYRKMEKSACFLVVGGTGIEPVTPAV